jgi:carboxyl-terminal processing protease
MRRFARVLPLLAPLAVLPLVAQQPQTPPAKGISLLDRNLSLQMLANVKSDLRDNYYDKTFHGLDLEAAFTDAEQRIRSAASVNETVGIIAEVLTRLNDSHTWFVPPGRRTRVVYGWKATIIGDDPYVTEVKKESDAAKKGLAPGDRILAWNRFQPTRQNLWQIEYLYDLVRPQSMQRIIVRKPDGSETPVDVESKLELRPPDVSILEVLNDLRYAEYEPSDRWVMAGDIFVWRCGSFDDPKQIDAVIKQARHARSMVLDLRGNPGGDVDALRELVARLFDRTVHIATEITRKGERPVDAKGRKDAFTLPLVVLVDSRSASASEVTARVVQIEKRATVIGDRTAGAVMAATPITHELGMESVAFYGASITVADLRMADGKSLEHTGVTPDEIVLPTAADLAAGRDPVLARAVAALGGTLTAEQAGKLFR